MSELVMAELVKKEQLKSDIFKFSVKAPSIVKEAKPGNFIEIRVTDQLDPFLRRPISIYNQDRENGILEFIFQVKGKGTELLAKREEGKNIDIVGPIGYGTFKYDNYEKIAIIGGGIGVFPLYELAKCAKVDNKKVTTYLGKNRFHFCLRTFTNVKGSTKISNRKRNPVSNFFGGKDGMWFRCVFGLCCENSEKSKRCSRVLACL